MIDNFHINTISNIISDTLLQKFRMNPSYRIALVTTISYTIMNIQELRDPLYSVYTEYGSMLIPVIVVCAWWVYRCRLGKSEIRIFTPDAYDAVVFMIEKNPHFFDRYPSYINKDDVCSEYVLDPHFSSDFFDAIHNVQGTIKGGSETEDIVRESHNITQTRYFVCVSIDRQTGMSPKQYLDKLIEYRKNEESKGSHIKLVSYKVLYNYEDKDVINHKLVIYEGEKNNLDERYDLYMKSYFSPNRDWLWNYIKAVQFNPEKFSKFGQEARCNLLLHGPPGSGKSTFVYRLAMCLNRHIVSVDISNLTHRRYDLYQIIQSPIINCRKADPSNVIILLEEFDLTVQFLQQNKTVRGNKGKEDKEGKECKTNKEGKEDLEKNVNLFNENRRGFQVEDLLEVLQGPVPVKGSIIIATTNKYEHIRQICPSLFRPGRLTPIEFNYMSWDNLQELTEYYFNQELTIKHRPITTPTSEIIELAVQCSLYNTGGDIFQSKLDKLL